MGWKNPTIGRRIEDPKYPMSIRIEASAEHDRPSSFRKKHQFSGPFLLWWRTEKAEHPVIKTDAAGI
jgi:hypothetical protein